MFYLFLDFIKVLVNSNSSLSNFVWYFVKYDNLVFMDFISFSVIFELQFSTKQKCEILPSQLTEIK